MDDFTLILGLGKFEVSAVSEFSQSQFYWTCLCPLTFKGLYRYIVSPEQCLLDSDSAFCYRCGINWLASCLLVPVLYEDQQSSCMMPRMTYSAPVMGVPGPWSSTACYDSRFKSPPVQSCRHDVALQVQGTPSSGQTRIFIKLKSFQFFFYNFCSVSILRNHIPQHSNVFQLHAEEQSHWLYLPSHRNILPFWKTISADSFCYLLTLLILQGFVSSDGAAPFTTQIRAQV